MAQNNAVMQTNYRPQIAPAYVGMIADMVEYSIQTRLCETANGIPFGVAVSQGTNDKGAILGGAAFVGISVVDVTQVLAPIDPLSTTYDTVDMYGKGKNMAVLSRGHVWVLAGADVAPADPLYYNTANGGLTNSASGQAATGSITFTTIPVDGNTLVINGATVTFKASGAVGDQVNIAPTLGDTIARLATVLNGSGTAGFAALKYAASPSSPGGAGQGSGADTLMIADKTVGTAGNALALTVTGTPGATASGGTLAGGTASATLISGGRWNTGAIAGQLAKIGLANQT